MRGLSNREKRLLLFCFLTIFVMANIFAGRAVWKTLRGSRSQITGLKSELEESRMWLEEKDEWDRRREWLDTNMLPAITSVGGAQGALIESLQQGVFDRTLKIERQSLLEPVSNSFYGEVAVNLRVRGEEAKITEWLSTLQSPEKFQVLKTLKLEPDTKSKETEPQAICDVTVARWHAPQSQTPEPAVPDESGIPAQPEGASPGEKAPEEGGEEEGEKSSPKSKGAQLTSK